MAEINCEACETLRQEVPQLVCNGFDDEMCASLQNDTGLNPSSGSNDCTDLNNLNDCLIGNMEEDVDLYEVCDWKTFMESFIPNIWTVLKAMICAICGLWTNVHNLWDKISEILSQIQEIINKLNAVSYIGIMTLYTTTLVLGTKNAKKQVPAFNAYSLDGNLSGVLSPTSDYKGIIVNNTTSVPLLVETTFNCSIRTGQHMASCYVVVTRDGYAVGQTPFITPKTYDQQVTAEAFILQPNQSTVMNYYFGVGDANDSTWFEKLFYGDSKKDVQACLEPRNTADPENQRSYFTVRVTSVVAQS